MQYTSLWSCTLVKLLSDAAHFYCCIFTRNESEIMRILENPHGWASDKLNQADKSCSRSHKHAHHDEGWNQAEFASLPALRCTVERDYTAQRFSNTPLIMSTLWLSRPQCTNTHMQTLTNDYSSSQQTVTRNWTCRHSHKVLDGL